ncbi:protein-export chaperone SecB [Inmirania thermothiophila]|uniref:Protein-export protein SecB n=1 Tax=Inmirania thermothiophila TaxID=1750597 RepID=A0A3N1Y5X7_9GAMM|nr:protein-export chaperone SecB [Inmirania thermothiophila]ROR34214.1 protein translocase subunit secB [Inmirania thermothiophila]
MSGRPEDAAAGGGERQVLIERLYVKDVSFEAPNSPAVFAEKWEPQAEVQLGSNARPLEGDAYEVVLTVTVTARLGERTAFLVEVQQAGVFRVRGFEEKELGPVLGAFCPGTLYPYAREAVGSLVAKGGFPPVILAPVDFNAVYAQSRRQQQAAGRH